MNPGLFAIKLKTGLSWRYRYRDIDGKRVVDTIAGGGTKPEQAAAIAEEIRAQLKKSISPRLEKARRDQEEAELKAKAQANEFQTLGAFLAEIYIPHLNKRAGAPKAEWKNKSHPTTQNIKSNFAHLFDYSMNSVTPAHIRQWETDRSDIKRPTKARALAALKGMLSYAAGKKKGDPNPAPVIDANPLQGVTLSPETAAEREAEAIASEGQDQARQLLTASDVKKVRKGLELLGKKIRTQRERSRKHGKPELPSLLSVKYPHWFIPFCEIARLTGMRPGDIARLRWTNIVTLARIKGDALKFKPHKTLHHANPIEVTFPITGELEQVLTDWRKQNGDPKTGLVFPSKRIDTHMDKNAYQRHWIEVKKLGDLPAELQFYSFRHSFISDRVNAGWPLLRLAKLVGHKTTDMIAHNYFRDDLEELAGALREMDRRTQRATREASA
ncbi:tyrosine-type recombinase/integrase [Pseudohongiella acticola]|uniref:tyrosine-type recombinase/integrase n=1 Tax=Pseudohongiella acticola TaxID=1524254 RepID=UPI0030ED6991